MAEKYIKASDCEKYFYEHLDDLHMEGAMNAIDEMPNEDVVPVVRCKDCKFRSSWMMNRNLRYICPESGMFPNCENDFCSYGKWKGGKDHA